MSDWLRPVFGRARPPISPVAPSFVGGDHLNSLNSLVADDILDVDDIGRLKPSPRVSSFVNFRTGAAPVPVNETATWPRFDYDAVYHQPSGDQMAEMLQVAMLRLGTCDPLPVEYNSCIAHVLEAYAAQKSEIDKRNKLLEAANQKLTSTKRAFGDLAAAWEVKEKGYQTELKRLEVILSRTDGGMEKVSLARSKSTVHGSRSIREVVKYIDRVGPIGLGLNVPKNDATDTKHDSDRPPLYMRPGQLTLSNYRRPYTDITADDLEHGSETGLKNTTPEPQKSSRRSTTSENPESRTSLVDEQTKSDFDIGAESDEASSLSSTDTVQARHARRHSGDSALSSSSRHLFAKLKRVFGEEVPRSPNQAGFSFNEGDETSFLSQRKGMDEKMLGTTTVVVPTPSKQFTKSKSKDDTATAFPRSSGTAKFKPLAESAKQSETYELLQTSKERKTRQPVIRFGGIAGRIGSDGFEVSTANRRHDRRSGSSDAVTAAVLAVARTSRGSDEQTSSTSESASDVVLQVSTSRQADKIVRKKS